MSTLPVDNDVDVECGVSAEPEILVGTEVEKRPAFRGNAGRPPVTDLTRPIKNGQIWGHQEASIGLPGRE